MMSQSQLQAVADEAYATALATDNPTERAYAAGVEDLARALSLGMDRTPALKQLFRDAEFLTRVRQDPRRAGA